MSRDPDRIEPTLKAIEEVWRANPDMRFGQLVVNLTRQLGQHDPWFPEEESWVRAAKDAAANGWRVP